MNMALYTPAASAAFRPARKGGQRPASRAVAIAEARKSHGPDSGPSRGGARPVVAASARGDPPAAAPPAAAVALASVILAADPSLAATKALDPATGTGKQAYQQELCRIIYERGAEPESSEPRPGDYCRYLEDRGISLASVPAPSAQGSAAVPTPARPAAAAERAASTKGAGAADIPYGAIGALIGVLGVGAAGASSASERKLRGELEAAREEIAGLKAAADVGPQAAEVAQEDEAKPPAAAMPMKEEAPAPPKDRAVALPPEVPARAVNGAVAAPPAGKGSEVPKKEVSLPPVEATSGDAGKEAAAAGKGAFYVELPSDMFDGLSPERKAADALRNLFTFVAVRSVMAQEEGFDGSGQSAVYHGLVEACQTPITSSEEWVGSLMTAEDKDMQATAVNLLDIRQQYTEKQFDWRTMKAMARSGLQEERGRLCQWYRIKGADEVLSGVGEACEDEFLTPSGGKEGGKFWIDIDTVAFGGVSPERKAADALRNLFTYVAVRAVMMQEGEGRVYDHLADGIDKGIGSGDKFVGGLMKREDDYDLNLTGVRILAVREQYMEGQFDWKVLKKAAADGLREETARLGDRFPESLSAAAAAAASDEAEGVAAMEPVEDYQEGDGEEASVVQGDAVAVAAGAQGDAVEGGGEVVEVKA